ncbi:hypothetical protein EFM07_12805 [Lactococcus lactis]|uniref:hypothetical protein n=1 Tax=Lactococcus lactis TaxID=1358 RepID=UPI00223AADE6|nr:hypothetical protein [Lactococcus lactis]MCT1228215.1 hypothetical protein [Lactococcus lactis]
MTQNKEAERKPIDPKDVNQFVNGLNDYRDNWMSEINGKDYLTPNRKIEGNKKSKKEQKNSTKVLQKIEELLNDSNKSVDSEMILQIAKKKLESGEFNSEDAESFIVHDLLLLTTTPGKQGITNKERDYINSQRKIGGMRTALISVIGTIIILLAWAIKMGIFK